MVVRVARAVLVNVLVRVRLLPVGVSVVALESRRVHVVVDVCRAVRMRVLVLVLHVLVLVAAVPMLVGRAVRMRVLVGMRLVVRVIAQEASA